MPQPVEEDDELGLFGLKPRQGRVAAFGRAAPEQWSASPAAPAPAPEPTGNASFDAYRAATLARLEAEQTEFVVFLDRLRHARDAEEFQSFMADRATTA